MSPGVAWALVISLAVTGMSIVALNFGVLISSLYAFGISLGTVYSIPPFRYHERKGRWPYQQNRSTHIDKTASTCRLKRFAVPAFMIIATVRGFLLNFGVYYSTKAALGAQFAWSPAIM